ncbi:tRNA lysidine(34) synthetase TilS [Hamadaea tsunoensis]|uniref:tRNA lysidine(34) synthetase TilS n=1 Tax=Hamadaea tsunoensis TaxID=53368 RepID=UPI000405A92E|nr:tRNA lysidine(34) synthetase TilS [Hamadaea tsunoensis]
MAGPPPAVAALRLAVRRCLAPLPAGLVLVACSGGADSLALASAAAWVGARTGRAIGLVTVDHGLQPGSADRAAQVVAWAGTAGLTPAVVAAVAIDPADPLGPEAAARNARYQALRHHSQEYASTAVLLGHTVDDQAETVLLALARGAGPRGLSGMPERRTVDGLTLLRPFLGERRATTRAYCVEAGLSPWDDPHNADPRYARARVRADLLPALVDTLGDGVVGNLARTAGQIAADSAYLDELASAAADDCRSGDGLDVHRLADLPAALRTRVLHAWALGLGAEPAALGHRHVAAMAALVVDWHGQGPTMLPGAIVVTRAGGRLTGRAAPPPG